MHPAPRFAVALAAAASVLLAFGCTDNPPFPTTEELRHLRGLLPASRPPPSPTNKYADDPRAAALGAQLFTEDRISSCGISCSNCHPAPLFVTPQRLNGGCEGKPPRNAPTLLNVSFGRWFYWDGQKDSLWAHPILPLTRRTEMATTPEQLRADLQDLVVPGTGGYAYRGTYQELFGKAPAEHEPLQVMANVGKALEAYLRTLNAQESPFDEGVRAMIAAAEKDIALNAEDDPSARALPQYLGLKTFFRKGRCIACHQGPQLADELFHNVGVSDPDGPDRGRAEGMELVLADPLNGGGIYSDDRAHGQGRLDRIAATVPATEQPEGTFKTASLRNVALSAPYMHNGRLNTLEEVVEFYGRGGDAPGTFAGKKSDTVKPLALTPEEDGALVDLLKSLTAHELR